MPNSALRPVPADASEVLAASNVGTWRTAQSAQHYVTDEITAVLLGVDPAQAAEGLPLFAYARAVHPADRALFHDRLGRVTERGGLFVMEYRTTPREGGMRWVLARGRYERDAATGAMRGRGILIDITESKLDGHAEERALFVAPRTHGSPLDRAADLAMETRRAIDTIEGGEKAILRRAVDALLWALGQALARRAASTDARQR